MFSHSKYDTITSLLPFLIDISSILKCDIISYDYIGTGLSSGKYNEDDVQTSLENIIDFMCSVTDIKLNNILLMGQSFGAKPTVQVVSKSKYDNIAGIILISPLENYLASKYNKTMNITISNIQSVKCPVFLIQGKYDLKEQVEKTEELATYITNLYKWFPKKQRTANILNGCRWKFYKKFMNFIDFIKQKSFHKISTHHLNLSTPIDNINNQHIVNNTINKNYISFTIDGEDYLNSYNKDNYSER